MKKIGIVSSFDVLCGNATYSEVLAEGLRKYAQITKIAISPSLQKKHERHKIRKILDQIDSCDGINLQMELGLYGPTPQKATRLINKIFKRANKLSVTMHRIDPKPDNLLRSTYNIAKRSGIYGPWLALKNIFTHTIKKTTYIQYKKIILNAHRKSGVFIVHTQREKTRILTICPKAKVLVHPIVWPDTLPCNHTINTTEKFTNGLPIIGLFGFLSPYKNFESVVSLASQLGYNIVIGGGTHPSSHNYGMKSTNSTAKNLSNEMLNGTPSISSQFYHFTAPDDATLINLIKNVDIVVIPYFETGQSGSGIASLAVQYGKRVIFSDTALINELAPFLNKKPFIFDVNSAAGLTFAIEDALKHHDPGSIYFKDHTFETNIKNYLLSFASGEKPT